MHATTERNLENMMFSERSQAQETTDCIIPILRNVQKRQRYRETESKLEVACGWRWEWAQGFFLGTENVKLDCGAIYTAL